jgi:hypothetical protein
MNYGILLMDLNSVFQNPQFGNEEEELMDMEYDGEELIDMDFEGEELMDLNTNGNGCWQPTYGRGVGKPLCMSCWH